MFLKTNSCLLKIQLKISHFKRYIWDLLQNTGREDRGVYGDIDRSRLVTVV